MSSGWLRQWTVLIFGVLGIVLYFLGRRFAQFRSLRVTLSILLFLGFMSLHWAYPRLAWYAAVLLCAGLSVQLARLAARHPDHFFSVIRLPARQGRVLTGWLKRGDREARAREDRAGDSMPSRREFLVSIGTTLAGL